jgi:hypothetical protein
MVSTHMIVGADPSGRRGRISEAHRGNGAEKAQEFYSQITLMALPLTVSSSKLLDAAAAIKKP